MRWVRLALTVAIVAVGAALVYGKGAQDGERLGRVIGQIEGSHRMMAEVTRVLSPRSRR